MVRPRGFHEDQVLAGAMAVFREHGYEGTSVPELITRLGICRQSLYNAFGDKRGLYLRALAEYGRREVDAKLALLASEGSPLENLRTVIRGFAALAPACPSEGCFTVSAMVESREDDDVLALAAEQVGRLEGALADALTRARAAGEVRPDVQPERVARAITTSLYGVGLLTRLPDSSARIGATVSVLLEWVDSVAVGG